MIRNMPSDWRSLPVAVLTTLATLALAPAASATFPARNGLIAFQAQTDHGIQIFTVRPNGHDLRQITHVDGEATGPGLVAGWPPDRLHGQRVLGGDHGRRRQRPQPHRRRLEHVPERSVVHPRWDPPGVRTLRLVGHRAPRSLEHEAGWVRQAVRHRRGETDPNVSPDGRRLSFKDSASGAVGPEHGWQRPRPGLAHGLGRLQARLGARRATSRLQRQLRTRPDRRGEHRDRSPRRIRDCSTSPTTPAPVIAYVGSYSPDGQWIVFRLVKDGLSRSTGCGPTGRSSTPILQPSPTFVAEAHRLGTRDPGLSPVANASRRRSGSP